MCYHPFNFFEIFNIQVGIRESGSKLLCFSINDNCLLFEMITKKCSNYYWKHLPVRVIQFGNIVSYFIYGMQIRLIEDKEWRRCVGGGAHYSVGYCTGSDETRPLPIEGKTNCISFVNMVG